MISLRQIGVPAVAVKAAEELELAALLAEAVRLAGEHHNGLSAVEFADPVPLVVLLFARQAPCASLHLHPAPQAEPLSSSTHCLLIHTCRNIIWGSHLADDDGGRQRALGSG